MWILVLQAPSSGVTLQAARQCSSSSVTTAQMQRDLTPLQQQRQSVHQCSQRSHNIIGGSSGEAIFAEWTLEHLICGCNGIIHAKAKL